MNQSVSFFETFFKKLAKVNEILDSYQKKPNEENIHDIRTSIRRLESAYSIFPKSSRTKNSDKQMGAFKKFFSINNKIRDYDIILAKLQEYEIDPESYLVLSITKKKFMRLTKALSLAKKLSKLKKPKIKENSKINSKFDKSLLSLIQEFNEYIPIVVSDESKVDELHAMRKTVKKLRYVLELDPSHSYNRLISQIKQLQQILGYIHDCDIFICYFEKKSRFSNISKIINFEKRKRNIIYQNLVFALSGFIQKMDSNLV